MDTEKLQRIHAAMVLVCCDPHAMYLVRCLINPVAQYETISSVQAVAK